MVPSPRDWVLCFGNWVQGPRWGLPGGLCGWGSKGWILDMGSQMILGWGHEWGPWVGPWGWGGPCCGVLGGILGLGSLLWVPGWVPRFRGPWGGPGCAPKGESPTPDPPIPPAAGSDPARPLRALPGQGPALPTPDQVQRSPEGLRGAGLSNKGATRSGRVGTALLPSLSLGETEARPGRGAAPPLHPQGGTGTGSLWGPPKKETTIIPTVSLSPQSHCPHGGVVLTAPCPPQTSSDGKGRWGDTVRPPGRWGGGHGGHCEPPGRWGHGGHCEPPGSCSGVSGPHDGPSLGQGHCGCRVGGLRDPCAPKAAGAG